MFHNYTALDENGTFCSSYPSPPIGYIIINDSVIVIHNVAPVVIIAGWKGQIIIFCHQVIGRFSGNIVIESLGRIIMGRFVRLVGWHDFFESSMHTFLLGQFFSLGNNLLSFWNDSVSFWNGSISSLQTLCFSSLGRRSLM